MWQLRTNLRADGVFNSSRNNQSRVPFPASMLSDFYGKQEITKRLGWISCFSFIYKPLVSWIKRSQSPLHHRLSPPICHYGCHRPAMCATRPAAGRRHPNASTNTNGNASFRLIHWRIVHSSAMWRVKHYYNNFYWDGQIWFSESGKQNASE